ncbi:receptor-type tyrosine-protein phosphatase F-like [Littorina saxatilis]|uniref:Fibronectin type-III domain-containing protein n=1 Tax=Littorina saxatilis TaxID=31220 RepID=A0AAN9G4X1_9CAEN
MFYIWIVLLCSSGLACVQGGQVFRSVEHKQVSDSEVQVSWVISPAQALSWNYKISHTFHLSQIGDCQPVLRSTQISRQLESSQTFLRLTGLQAWRTYQYKLKAPVTYFKQEEVATGTFSTRPTRFPSSTVRNVHVENVTQNSADLSWQEPPCVERNGPLRRFDVLLIGADSQNVLNAYTGVCVTVGNLKAGTTYLVRVRYVNTIGPSPFTADVSFTTSPSAFQRQMTQRRASVNLGQDTDRSFCNVVFMQLALFYSFF